MPPRRPGGRGSIDAAPFAAGTRLFASAESEGKQLSTPQAAARPSPRRSDAGRVRLQQRDIDGLLLVAEHYAAPYDLLSAALAVTPPRLRGITARWRAAGLAATGTLGPGPAWCWLTPADMAASGHRWPAGPPSLARLAHIRAVLATRISLQAAPGYAQAGAWWHAERRIRAALPASAAKPHIADAEIHWPSAPPGPHAGQVWAVEVELTPRPPPAPRGSWPGYSPAPATPTSST
jgi:hypothetical protein